MIRQIPIDPYPKKYWLIYEETDADVMHFFHKEPDDFKAIYRVSPENDALTIRTPRGSVVTRFHTRPSEPGIIAHEAFHAAYAILDYVGMTLSDSSEEAFAYMVDWLTSHIHKTINENGKEETLHNS